MKLNEFSEMIVAEAVTNIEFSPLLDVERYYLDFERELSSIFEKKAILTKVPDGTQAAAPRFVLNSKNNRRLDVSLVNAIFKTNPNNVEKDKALEIYKDKSRKIISLFNKNNLFNIENIKIFVTCQFKKKDMGSPFVGNFFNKFIRYIANNVTGAGFDFAQSINDGFTVKTRIEKFDFLEANFNIDNLHKKVKHGNQYIVKIPNSLMKKVATGISVKINLEPEEAYFLKFEDPLSFFDHLFKTFKSEIDRNKTLIFN